jgi:hypothetical protein
MMKKWVILFLAVFVLCSTHQDIFAETFDHSKFDRILKQHVDDKGLVDYNRISTDPRLKEYMQSLASVKVDQLSANGQLALWLNAYNAVTIDKVIKWKPKKSVRETIVPGVWTSTKFFTTRDHIVAGRRLSQDDIENEILRKMLKEPRIHFSIVCASSSCPLLARFAFTQENVQAKLEEKTRKYIRSSRGTRIDYAENTLYLSKLFDWFAGDFEFQSGSVLEFIKPYLTKEEMAFLERNPKIAYIHYDWALNAKEPLR